MSQNSSSIRNNSSSQSGISSSSASGQDQDQQAASAQSCSNGSDLAVEQFPNMVKINKRAHSKPRKPRSDGNAEENVDDGITEILESKQREQHPGGFFYTLKGNGGDQFSFEQRKNCDKITNQLHKQNLKLDFLLQH